MEGYGLEELAASAEAVLAGLGPLAVALAGLAGGACGAVTLEAMEALVTGQGRELLRGVVQLGLDAQADGEVRVAQVTGADGVPRRRAERGHSRPVVTTLGEVTVRRIGYRSGIKGGGVAVPARCGAEPAAVRVLVGAAAAGGDVLPVGCFRAGA